MYFREAFPAPGPVRITSHEPTGLGTLCVSDASATVVSLTKSPSSSSLGAYYSLALCQKHPSELSGFCCGTENGSGARHYPFGSLFGAAVTFSPVSLAALARPASDARRQRAQVTTLAGRNNRAGVGPVSHSLEARPVPLLFTMTPAVSSLSPPRRFN